MTVIVVGYGGCGGGVGRRRRLFARALDPAAAARHRHSHVPYAVRSSSRATGPAFDSTGKRRRDHIVFASLFVVAVFGSFADVRTITVITVTISTRVVVQFRKQIELQVPRCMVLPAAESVVASAAAVAVVTIRDRDERRRCPESARGPREFGRQR